MIFIGVKLFGSYLTVFISHTDSTVSSKSQTAVVLPLLSAQVSQDPQCIRNRSAAQLISTSQSQPALTMPCTNCVVNKRRLDICIFTAVSCFQTHLPSHNNPNLRPHQAAAPTRYPLHLCHNRNHLAIYHYT